MSPFEPRPSASCRIRNTMIEFELTDEQRLIRETAADFSDREVAPRARENDRNEHFDTELVQKLADMGFLGAIVPEEYGGRGVDYLTYGLIVEQIGRNDSAMRTVISVVTSLVCSSIVRWGTEEQKQEWLSQQRRQDVDLPRELREARDDLRADGPREEAQGIGLLPGANR